VLRTTPQTVWDVYMVSIVAFALWRGGRPERVIALAGLLASVASAVLQTDPNDLINPQWGDLVVDLAYLGLVLWFALRSDRHWTLWAAAFQLLGVVTYVARMADLRVGAKAPFTASVIWSYLVLAALAVGTWLHWRGSRARA
jgi:hypothetical protein